MPIRTHNRFLPTKGLREEKSSKGAHEAPDIVETNNETLL